MKFRFEEYAGGMFCRTPICAACAFPTLHAWETRVQTKDLPEPVQKTVQEQRKGAKLRGLAGEVENGKTFSEAETTVDEKSRDIPIDATGAIVEVEEAANLEIPDAALKAFKTAAASKRIDEYENT